MLLTILLACRASAPDDGPAPAPTSPFVDPCDTAPPQETGGSDTSPRGDTAGSSAPLQALAEAEAHALTVTLSGRQGPATLTCTVPDDPAEEHVLTAADDCLRLRGLLADTRHTCTVSTDDDELSFETTTTPSPITPSWDLIEHDPARMSGHYTLFNHGLWGDVRDTPHELIIVDPEGRTRWVKVMDKPAPDLDASILADGTLLYGGGKRWRPTIETLDGEVLWTAPPSTTGGTTHHHAEQLPSGEIITLVHADDIDPDTLESWTGFAIERWAPDGTLTWSWRSQRGVEEGWLSRTNPDQDDPWHANALVVRDGITYVNLRQKRWLVALDDDGSLRWRMGSTAGGDIELVDADGLPADAADWFYGPHAPELHPDGRFLLYDNGYGRPGGGSSRAMELVLDEDAMQATVTWSWWGEEPWYEPIWGDIDELPGGNVLLTKGHCDDCAEGQRSEQLEVHRASGEVVWRIRHHTADDAAYRAQRLDGCDLFANRRYCPTIGG